MKDISENPLLTKWDLTDGAVPFDKIQIDHYIPAVESGIEMAYANIESVKKKVPSFENTIVGMETASEKLDRVTSVYFSLFSAEATPELQALAQHISKKLAQLNSDLYLDETLFEKVRAVYEQKEGLKLSKEENTLLNDFFTQFKRNGALLKADEKKELRQIDQELSALSPQFSENVLKATNSFHIHITDKNELEGMPDSALKAASEEAESKGYSSGWVFTLHAPSMVPLLKYCPTQKVREKVWKAYSSRAFDDEFDNSEFVKKIVSLRLKRAQLLGYKSHAEFVMEQRMAERTDKVVSFLERLIEVSKPAAEREFQELKNFAQKVDGVQDLKPWDQAYYSEKLKQSQFQFDEEAFRPYFKLENVIDGMFLHAEKLFNLQFKKIELPVYHPDVDVYQVSYKDSGDYVGLLYTDFFPRETKRGGAWMGTYRDQGLFEGSVKRPHAVIVCNFTKPTKDKPSLLTIQEVETLFHESGHALHGLLSQCQYRSTGGTNVKWDFVELPSQIFENWVSEKESLSLFAKHYETGEVIPEDLVKKLIEVKNFQAGLFSLRQLNYGTLDMKWHTIESEETISSVPDFEKLATEKTRLIDVIPGTNMSCSFSHIFAGGYSAGYYSYKWAEVLDADAFEAFKESDLFDKKVASSFHDNILTRGGSEPPMDLYKRFRGREPDPDALLRRSGLL